MNFEYWYSRTGNKCHLNPTFKISIVSRCNSSLLIFNVGLPCQFNKMCKKCLSALSQDELNDFKHQFILTKLKGE